MKNVLFCLAQKLFLLSEKNEAGHNLSQIATKHYGYDIKFA